MKRGVFIVGLAGCVVLPAGLARGADTSSLHLGAPNPAGATEGHSGLDDFNPYNIIMARNVFHLVPPPPPMLPLIAPPAPDPPPKIEFTGFYDMGGKKKAMFQTVATKDPADMEYFNVSQGETEGTLQLVRLDIENEEASVLYAGAPLTLHIKGLTLPAVPTGNGVAGTAGGVPMTIMVPMTYPSSSAGDAMPASSGVMVAGASSSAPGNYGSGQPQGFGNAGGQALNPDQVNMGNVNMIPIASSSVTQPSWPPEPKFRSTAEELVAIAAQQMANDQGLSLNGPQRDPNSKWPAGVTADQIFGKRPSPPGPVTITADGNVLPPVSGEAGSQGNGMGN